MVEDLYQQLRDFTEKTQQELAELADKSNESVAGAFVTLRSRGIQHGTRPDQTRPECDSNYATFKLTPRFARAAAGRATRGAAQIEARSVRVSHLYLSSDST